MKKRSLSPISIPALVFVCCSDLIHSDSGKMISKQFEFAFLGAKNGEHFSKYLLAICISYFENLVFGDA